MSWLLVLGQLMACTAWGDVRLPGLVGDNMVLQRDSRVVIWGWAEPGERVRIDFRGQRMTVRTDRGGQWSASLGPFPAGGPYQMTIAGRNRIALRNILLGDVWLASGQSNMEAPLGPDESWGWKGVDNVERELRSAHFQHIRLFKAHRKIALTPTQDAQADGWATLTPDSAKSFSAVAYLFGRELHRRYGVPIGLIESSWGGTLAEAWVSEASLQAFPEFRESIDSLRRIDETAVMLEYPGYLQRKSAWYRQHGEEDRGRSDGHYLWAAPGFAADWPTTDEPQAREMEALDGFDGVVWFRKEVDVPAECAGQEALLQLPGAYKSDVTFFNGTQVGQTDTGDQPKEYPVPGSLVKAGRNVIVIRLTGSNGFVGMYGDRDRMLLTVGGQVLPLAGVWSYQPGADLSSLPIPPEYARIKSSPRAPTVLFNGMIAPLVRYRIKGVIWYQGEANAVAKRSAGYRSLFPALIRDWRRQWGYEFPFLFVQLAGWGPNETEPAEYQWAELREAQSMALSVPATGMATAVDVGDEHDIHPRDKQTVAHRLVLAAARVAYGEKVIDSGPVFESLRAEGNRMRIRFSSLGSGLRVRDKYGYVRGFEVAGRDGRFHWAQARQDGDDIVVFSQDVLEPEAVRYGWSNTPDGNVFNEEGLPAPPFRTDAPQPPYAASDTARR